MSSIKRRGFCNYNFTILYVQLVYFQVWPKTQNMNQNSVLRVYYGCQEAQKAFTCTGTLLRNFDF